MNINKCPLCSSELIKRINKNTKDWFWGCSMFPKCKYSANRPKTHKEREIEIWAWANSQ
jgi:ssDNA-binding Zn-finger/Zn-ribbon topoisomerase 1